MNSPASNATQQKTLTIGAIEIKTDKCYIDGKPTRNPVLIGLALLDFLEHNSEPPGFQETFELLTNHIKDNNLRQTYERKELLKAVHECGSSFRAEDLYLAMANRKHPISRATIYNAIELFLSAKIIVKSFEMVEEKTFPSMRFELKNQNNP